MKKEQIFTEEEIRGIAELGEVLRGIHSRLVAEGKVRVDENGKIVFISTENETKK